MQMPSPPPLEEREFLRICPTKPGACYAYEVCVKKVIGICTKKEWVEEYFDLQDPNVRAKLIDMGFQFRKD